MSHYNYCGICQGITLHHYDYTNGTRWELCDSHSHEPTMSEVVAKLSSIVRKKVGQ